MAVAAEAGIECDVVLYMSDRLDRDTLEGIVDRLEDPDNVDARRKSVGLGPLLEYLILFGDVKIVR